MRRRRNPDDPALLARVKLKITKSRSRVDVRAYDGAQMVGGAMFVRAPWTAQRHEKNVLESLSTEVSKPYQRKGLASLIYRTLTAQGFTIHPSSSQTWQGQQLWEGGRWPGKREVYQKRYPSTWKEKVATLRDNPEVGSTLRAMTARAFPGRSAHDVNRGDCDTWARKARGTLRGGQVIYLLDQYGVFEEYTAEPDGWGHDPSQKDHAVLLYQGKYYDAEDPDGAQRVRDLAYVRVGGRRTNPDDQDLLRRLTVEVDDDCAYAAGKMGRYVELRAFDGKNYAAVATLKLIGRTAHPIQVDTWPAYRRRGVMSWLLRWAETNLRCKVRDSKDLTADGRLFKQGRRRNPGDPNDILERLAAQIGVSKYTDVMRGWILADGRIIDLDKRDEDGMVVESIHHNEGLEDLEHRLSRGKDVRSRTGAFSSLVSSMPTTGAIRLADGGRGAMFHLAKVPTAAQVTACAQIAAAHRALDQDSIEIYWAPADRLLDVRPISAGKVRRILEALPGEPKARGNPRRNPPADLDSSEVIGGECGVWALAAASGRSVPEIRRAYLAAGVDIWGQGGEATGTKMHQMRRVIRHLGLDDRIVSVGFDAIHRGPRASMAMAVKNRFVSGSDGETFPVPNQEMSTVLDHATVGQIVAKARKSGLAAIAITGEITSKIRRGGGQRWREIGGTMHAIGYSPSQGVFDSALPNLGVINDPDYKALLGDTKPTGWHWHAHGDVVPKPARKALFWLFLRPVDPRA